MRSLQEHLKTITVAIQKVLLLLWSFAKSVIKGMWKWAAVAAAVVVAVIAVLNYLDDEEFLYSIRPDIDLLGWTYEPFWNGNEAGLIQIGAVTNHGPGSANRIGFDLYLEEPQEQLEFPVGFVTTSIPLLRAREEKKLQSATGHFSWKYGVEAPWGKMISLNLLVTYWDSDGNKYERIWYLNATDQDSPIISESAGEVLAPNLLLRWVHTKRNGVELTGRNQ